MIGKQIKKIRNQKKMSQGDVAHDAGISYVMLGMIERGQANPTIRTLRLIAEALDCEIKIGIKKKR